MYDQLTIRPQLEQWLIIVIPLYFLVANGLIKSVRFCLVKCASCAKSGKRRAKRRRQGHHLAASASPGEQLRTAVVLPYA